MTDWTLARCLDADPGAFFPERGVGNDVHEAAMALCWSCPIREDCLRWALENLSKHEDWGIWGGTTPNMRRQLKRGAA